MGGESVMWYLARVGHSDNNFIHTTICSAAIAVHYDDLQDDYCMLRRFKGILMNTSLELNNLGMVQHSSDYLNVHF